MIGNIGYPNDPRNLSAKSWGSVSPVSGVSGVANFPLCCSDYLLFMKVLLSHKSTYKSSCFYYDKKLPSNSIT